MSKLRDDLYQRMNGFKPVKNSKGEWYYNDPRYEDEDPRSQIKVADENSPNPKIDEILKDDMDNNPDDYYIWHTQEDDKVRSSHAAREGIIFNYNVPPEGGNPGEDYNCRCWAEPYYPNKNKQSDVVKVDLSGLPQYKGNEDKYDNKYQIGSLSQEFESNQKADAIGYDDKGGYSYELYQIATKPGTMQEFLQFLNKSSNTNYRNFAKLLSIAGGNYGAVLKTIEFEKMWKKLAKDPIFASSQSEFIGKNRYDRIMNRIQDIEGLNLKNRHPVISDVIRSMAVQHGSADIPIHQALGHNSDISSWSDKQIINALYDARIDYVKKINYKTINDQKIQQNIINYRYPNERKKALELLKIKY